MKAAGMSVPEELLIQPPPFPAGLLYVWQWYCDHSMGLAVNGMAPAVVTWEGVDAWSRLMDIRLEPWEAKAIVHLGFKKANIEAERMNAEAKKRT